jgi:hypothetical protein
MSGIPAGSASGDYAYIGAAGPITPITDHNALTFLVERILGRTSVATLVQVQSVSNTPGQVAKIGTVDVLPLVNQVDGQGNSTPHGVVHGLSYFRFAGGTNAVLLDPVVGDIGLAVFADRDISSVKATGKQANPGSRRRFDMADGVYFGLAIGPTPTQYLAFTGDGITIVDKNGNKMVMSSSGIDFTSTSLTCTGEITAGQGGSDSVTLQKHKHGGVMTGSGETGEPVAGT